MDHQLVGGDRLALGAFRETRIAVGRPVVLQCDPGRFQTCPPHDLRKLHGYEAERHVHRKFLEERSSPHHRATTVRITPPWAPRCAVPRRAEEEDDTGPENWVQHGAGPDGRPADRVFVESSAPGFTEIVSLTTQQNGRER